MRYITSFAKEVRHLNRSLFLEITSPDKSGSPRWLLLFTILLLQACVPENLPISVQPDESKIAVASLVGPEEIVVVSLSKSFLRYPPKIFLIYLITLLSDY